MVVQLSSNRAQDCQLSFCRMHMRLGMCPPQSSSQLQATSQSHL